MVTVGVGPAVYVVALLTLSVNRFLLAALSAGLPRVVPREQLIIANTISPSLGAVAAVLGAGAGFVGGLVGARRTGPRRGGAGRRRAACSARRRRSRCGWVRTTSARATGSAASSCGTRPARSAAGLVGRRPAPDRSADPCLRARRGGGAPVRLRHHVAGRHPDGPQPAVRPHGRPGGPGDVRHGGRRDGRRFRGRGAGHPGRHPVDDPADLDRGVVGRRRWRASSCCCRPGAVERVRRRRAARAWARRPARSRWTPSCSATPTTTSVAGRSPPTTCCTTPPFVGAAALGAAVLPDTGLLAPDVRRARRGLRRRGAGRPHRLRAHGGGPRRLECACAPDRSVGRDGGVPRPGGSG